jgi:hypothetical protein
VRNSGLNITLFKEISMAVPVAVFNASSQAITITVNNGAQFSVAGTGPTQSWVPQTQASGTGPTYSPGYPAQNVVGNLGANQITAAVAGVPIGGGPFSFSLPNSYPVGSVQLYLFFQNVQSASWLVLTDGKICAQQIMSGPMAATELHHTHTTA